MATVDLSSFAEHLVASADGPAPGSGTGTDGVSVEGSVCGRMRPGLTVLVVDDEAEIVDDIVEHLEHLGYATCSASSGAEALTQISEHPQVRVCLTDIRMPEMDGIELLKELRLRDERRFMQMRWIMLTGHATPADERAAFAAGAGALLRKPCSLSEITAAVVQAFVALRGVECPGNPHGQEAPPEETARITPSPVDPRETDR